MTTRAPFDDRPSKVEIAEIRPGRIRTYLEESGSRVDADQPLPDLLEQLDLLGPGNGNRAPLNAAVLLFADEPQRTMRGARIEAAHLPEGRGARALNEQTFAGPLPDQIRKAFDWLSAHLSTQIEKQPNQPQSERVQAWPEAALREALINAVLHRSYATLHQDPTKIEVEPDCIVITSYPGPVAGITRAGLDQGKPENVPQRNRRIADFLRRLRLVETRGTGVRTMHEAMRRNGSPPPRFSFDEDRTYFSVELPIHPKLRPKLASVGWRAFHGRPAPAELRVGRDKTVDHLIGHVDVYGVAVLVGAPGVGRTTLLHALRDRVGSQRPVALVHTEGLSSQGRKAALLDAIKAPADTDDLDQALLQWTDDQRGLLLFDGEAPRLVVDSKGRVDVCVTLPEIHPDVEPKDSFFIVPPLDLAATRQLAAQVLPATSAPELVDEVAVVSGGLPGLLLRLARRLTLASSTTVESVRNAFDVELAALDDGGLKNLEKLWLRLAGSDRRLISSSPPRSRLVGELVDQGRSRGEAATFLRKLELHGVIAEVDGVIRPTVPHLMRAPKEYVHHDDIPF